MEKRSYNRFVKETVHLPTDLQHLDPALSCSVVVPRNYNYHGDEKFNSIQIVRDKLRRNKIDHLNFDAVLESSEGLKYHHTVYRQNQSTMQEKYKDNKFKLISEIIKEPLPFYKKERNHDGPNVID